MEKVIIVGTGCAGLTAAIYAARANLSPLVLEGREPGGQLTTTTLVENFPGFVEGIDGPQLIMNMKAQAERFGARFAYSHVTDFEPKQGHLSVKIDDEWTDTRALIIASGASARYLGLPDEKKQVGHGLTSCATCDGAFYRNVPVCVVGGGDSAAEEATFLTRFASKVYLIHRRDELRASKIMADRALSNPKVQPIWNTVLTQYLTDEHGEVRAVKLKNVNTGAESELEVKCVFVAIGHDPNTAPFKGKLDMDENGYLIQRGGTRTNVPGVFAAGDVADHVYRQAITAAGQGCAAALDAEKYLSHHGMKICDLTQFYSPVSGGVKRYICEKISYLHEFAPEDEHILIIPGDKDEVITCGKSKTYSIRSPLISKTSRYRALLRLSAVEEVLEKEKPTVIESGDPYQMAWKAIASGQALGIPVVGFYHSHFPEAYLRSTAKFFGPVAVDLVMDMAQRYVRNLYNRFARTLVPAPALGALLEEWGVRNVTNIDLGVNTRIFTPEPDDAAATRAQHGIPADRVLLLYVGRLAREKNTRTLFDAFEILSRDHPGWFHLLAIGDGNQRGELKELQAQTNAVSWVTYCGESAQLAQFYRAADIFVHPGVQETFGLVTLESQACGTPVVGIRGSYMDRIIHSDQAYWARENTPTALAQAILESSALNLKKMGGQASKKVLNLYSWQRVFERLFAIYRTVASE